MHIISGNHSPPTSLLSSPSSRLTTQHPLSVSLPTSEVSRPLEAATVKLITLTLLSRVVWNTEIRELVEGHTVNAALEATDASTEAVGEEDSWEENTATSETILDLRLRTQQPSVVTM